MILGFPKPAIFNFGDTLGKRFLSFLNQFWFFLKILTAPLYGFLTIIARWLQRSGRASPTPDEQICSKLEKTQIPMYLLARQPFGLARSPLPIKTRSLNWDSLTPQLWFFLDHRRSAGRFHPLAWQIPPLTHKNMLGICFCCTKKNLALGPPGPGH